MWSRTFEVEFTVFIKRSVDADWGDVDQANMRHYWWPENRLAEIEAACEALLRDYDLPCGKEGSYVAYSDGSYEVLPEFDPPLECGSGGQLEEVLIEPDAVIRWGPWSGAHGQGSEPWLAVKILQDIERVRNQWPSEGKDSIQMKLYDLRRLAQACLRVGERSKHLKLKPIEPAAVQGQRLQDNLRQARTASADARVKLRMQKIAEMSRWVMDAKGYNWVATNSDVDVARLVEKEFPSEDWPSGTPPRLRTLKDYAGEARKKRLLPRREK